MNQPDLLERLEQAARCSPEANPVEAEAAVEIRRLRPVAAAARDGRLGVIVRRIDRPILPGADFASLDNSNRPQWWTWRGDRNETAEPWQRLPDPPYHPGDVLEFTASACLCQHCRQQAVEYRLPVARVEAKPVREITWVEQQQCGFPDVVPGPKHYMTPLESEWIEQYGPGSWSRDWAWVIYMEQTQGE